MLLLMNWLTLNCVFQQKLTLESIQMAILQVLLLVLPETLSPLMLQQTPLLLPTAAVLSRMATVAHWLLVQEMALLGPMLHSIKAANPVHILNPSGDGGSHKYWACNSPHPADCYALGHGDRRPKTLYVHRGFLIKMETIFQIKPNLDPLLHSTYERKWLSQPHFVFRCNGTRGSHSSSEPLTTWEVHRNQLREIQKVGSSTLQMAWVMDLPRQPLLSIL